MAPVTESASESCENRVQLKHPLRFLTPDQILMIDEMLDNVTPYGEVTLRIKDCELKFASQSKSYDALKLQRPNALERKLNSTK